MILEIPGPPWCMCECCETCQYALWNDGAIVNCPSDGKPHGNEDSCAAWEPCEYLVETCEAGPCETCEARAWWDRKAQYWERRLAEL